MENAFQKFISFLGVPVRLPSLEYLCKLTEAHLKKVPYENLSKLARAQRLGPTLPSFEEYTEGAVRFGLGGTCFAQNAFFVELLQELGFDATLVAVRGAAGDVSHASCRVSINGTKFIVDLGLMARVAGPFSLASGAREEFFDRSRYLFMPNGDGLSYSLEIFRDGALIRSHRSESVPRNLSSFADAIADTFQKDALFMKALSVLRHFDDHSVGLWNRKLYVVQEQRATTHSIDSPNDLKSAFEKYLELPNYPIEEALEALRANGAPLF